MSDIVDPKALVPGTDITENDMARLQKFIEEGMPGYTKLDERTVKTMTDLYLGGSSYAQIAMTLNFRKELVLFAAEKYKWYLVKNIQLEELKDTIEARLEQARLEGRHTIVDVAQAMQKYIQAKLSAFHRTGDETHFLMIDPKMIDRFIKLQEVIGKPINPMPPQLPASPIGLNVGGGVTISKGEDGSVDITPKQLDIKEKMRLMAEEKRRKEKEDREAKAVAAQEQSYDIDINNTNVKTEKGESNES